LKDQNVRVACIGPAGENQIKIASIINEWRAVGRKGLGAVMGSKNLKAIAIRGSREVPVVDKEKLKTAKGEMTKAMKESHVLYPNFSKIGTPMVVDHTCATGIYRPEEGSIRFRGKDLMGLKPHRICRRGIARTFQLVFPVLII
jgi:aldehyde:ferredoxin oxidoreductase